MNSQEKRKLTSELGQRAIDYYLDTGFCVFCDADDCTGTPHDECDVGKASGVVVTPERTAEKAGQRLLVDMLIRKGK